MTEEIASPPPAPRAPHEGESFRRVVFDLPQGQMAGIAFGAEGPPDIVFLHATGFNARTYRILLEPLGERFRVLALDARGHGRTTLPAHTFLYASWRRHRDDLVEFLERYCTYPVTLVGHSMGATVSLLAAASRPDLVGALALIEPVIFSPTAYTLMEFPFAPTLNRMFFPIARKAGGRRARFFSREEARELLTGRGVFRDFPPEALADYVADGFVDANPAGVRLACTPAYESATYAAQRHDPWRALAQVEGPLVLLRAAHGSTISPASVQRVQAIKPDARIATVDGAGHMLPIERPDRTRSVIETAALMAGERRHFHEEVE